jgi:hypothetical protein
VGLSARETPRLTRLLHGGILIYVRCHVSTTIHFLSPAVALALLAAAPRQGDACPRAHRVDDVFPAAALSSRLTPPVVVDSGFEPPRFDPEHGAISGYLWLKLRPAPLAQPAAPARFVLERVAGTAPHSLDPIWGRPLVAEDDELFVPVLPDARLADYAFGVQVRSLDGDGESLPSEPIWMRSPAPAGRPEQRQRGDQVIFALGFLVIAALWLRQRSLRDPEARLRLVAVSGLLSAVLLLVTSAMPWLAANVEGRTVECLLGDEARCVATPAFALRDAAATAAASFELERWQCGAAAVQMGEILSFSLLLPALIWLLVDPRSRPAQASAAVGASIAAFTLLAIWFYRATVPSWASPELYRTFDLALLCAGNVVVAALTIVRHAFALDRRQDLPTAILR